MSGAHSNNEAPVKSMEPAITSEIEQNPEDSRNSRNSETSTSQALASIAKFLRSHEDQPITIKDVLHYIKSLSVELDKNSRLLERNGITTEDVSPMPPEASGSQDEPTGLDVLEVRKSAYERLRQERDDEHLQKETSMMLVHACNRGGLELRLGGEPFPAELISDPGDLDLYDESGQTPQLTRRQRQRFHQRQILQEHWRCKGTFRMSNRVKRYWYPPVGQTALDVSAEDPFLSDPRPLGNVWWMTDGPPSHSYAGVGHNHERSRTMALDDVAKLLYCFLPTRWSVSRHLERTHFEHFLQAFVNSTHPAAKPMWIHGSDSWALLMAQYHLTYFASVESDARSMPHPQEEQQPDRLALERQLLKINIIIGAKGHQLFQQRTLSVSLIILQRGTFRIVAFGDKGAAMPVPRESAYDMVKGKDRGIPYIDPHALGKAAGVSHFFITVACILHTWANGWKMTLDAIDRIVGFNMDDTFDDEQLEKYFFDRSRSMDLSKQYFTVLQLLREARQRIEDSIAEWQTFLGAMEASNNESTRERLVQRLLDDNEETLAIWKSQLATLSLFFNEKSKPLRERIVRKTEEVESLRNGLFNATSVREAMKGMALNRAIYIFTIVTIFYTPLGFMATFWALPILNTTPAGESIHLSSNILRNTFIIVPVLTYVFCGILAWYYTSDRVLTYFQRSRAKLAGFLNRMKARISGPMSRPWRRNERNGSDVELDSSPSA